MISESAQPKVLLVILNWNRHGETIACLESVIKSDYENYRIVVVDNGSCDHSIEEINAWAASKQHMQAVVYDVETGERGGRDDDERRLLQIAPSERIVLIASSENRGFAGGCNIGATYALRQHADFVFFLNNDASVAPQTLTHLVAVARRAGAGLVGASVWDSTGTVCLFSGRQWPAHLFGRLGKLEADAGRVYWPSGDLDGCAMMTSGTMLADRLDSCGHIFDPGLFLYCEDADLCLFGRSRGYTCVVARDAIVYHTVGSSSGGMFNPRSYYYSTRNRIYLAARWLDPPWRIVFHLYYAPSRILNAARWLLRGRRSVARAILCGLVDGYRGITGEWVVHEAPR